MAEVHLTNYAAERAFRGVVLGRKAWLFTGSNRDGKRAAMMYALIITVKMWVRAPDSPMCSPALHHPASWLNELLAWK
jgi:hypothetical protein